MVDQQKFDLNFNYIPQIKNYDLQNEYSNRTLGMEPEKKISKYCSNIDVQSYSQKKSKDSLAEVNSLKNGQTSFTQRLFPHNHTQYDNQLQEQSYVNQPEKYEQAQAYNSYNTSSEQNTTKWQSFNQQQTYYVNRVDEPQAKYVFDNEILLNFQIYTKDSLADLSCLNNGQTDNEQSFFSDNESQEHGCVNQSQKQEQTKGEHSFICQISCREQQNFDQKQCFNQQETYNVNTENKPILNYDVQPNIQQYDKDFLADTPWQNNGQTVFQHTPSAHNQLQEQCYDNQSEKYQQVQPKNSFIYQSRCTEQQNFDQKQCFIQQQTYKVSTENKPIFKYDVQPYTQKYNKDFLADMHQHNNGQTVIQHTYSQHNQLQKHGYDNQSEKQVQTKGEHSFIYKS
ncbi:hypothetical protein PPERSA_11928 [Pseudocohnilembus persalinus]|uniref:Uncharacterized protein n=1 Tax=Pseudocohnilembus persalinus TaxID=266149 RepID=A0A0V0QKC8_PSEPJ|nr:hypothetical protein PPERSA_11928 [Pseudocohnilembus persalinus]|eukprot:KRX02588.1 hypothetical protein PPERSA_11928 [Pseudocohnilembus persalinus]